MSVIYDPVEFILIIWEMRVVLSRHSAHLLHKIKFRFLDRDKHEPKFFQKLKITSRIKVLLKTAVRRMESRSLKQMFPEEEMPNSSIF